MAVHPGEIVACSGRTGGRTTTLSLLSGVLRPDWGEVLVDRGRVVAEGGTGEIAARFGGDAALIVEVEGVADPGRAEALGKLAGELRAEVEGPLGRAPLADLARAAPSVLGYLAARGARVLRDSTERATLEKAFLSPTGEGLRDR